MKVSINYNFEYYKYYKLFCEPIEYYKYYKLFCEPICEPIDFYRKFGYL